MDKAQEEKKLPDSIQHLADAMKEKGVTMQFGLEQQGHIAVIEEMLEEFGNHKGTWDKIGKKIGWIAEYAAYDYIDYLKDKIKVFEQRL